MRRESLVPVAISATVLVLLAFLSVTIAAHELDTLREPSTLVALGSSLLLCGLIPLLLRQRVRSLLDARTNLIQEDNLRLKAQQQALLRIANSKALLGGDIESALRELVEVGAITLSVERASVWLFEREHKSIRCSCLFERTPRRFTHGATVLSSEAPRYFAAIQTHRVLVADNVIENPLTNEFTFLAELGISSMLDAPIFVNGALFGIVCHEHVGPARIWTADEQSFASSIADMVAMAYEVHERRRVEGELRRTSRAIEASLEGIAIIERDETFSFVNPAFASIFGYDEKADLLGKSWRVLYETSQLRRLERHVFVSFLRAGNLQTEAVGLRKDGSTFSQELSLTPLGDGGLVCIVRDCSQRKEADQHLLESRRFLRKVIDTDPNFIFVKDSGGRFTLANQAVAEAYGTTVEQLLGKTDADFNPQPEEVKHFNADDQYVLTTGHELLVSEERITDAQGRERVLQTVKRPLTVPGRKDLHVLGVSTDITQRKQLQDQLVHAQKMEALGQLAGGIAHDFNNLMTGVLGYTTLMKLDPGDAESVHKSADIIEQAALRAAELTQKLLGFARKGKHQNAPVNLHATIDETLAIIKRTIRPSITVVTDLSAPYHFVLGDPIQMQQIILNLAINARDAMDPDIGGSDGGILCISTRSRLGSADPLPGISTTSTEGEIRPTLEIEVRDTGCGIDEDKREKVFEPFYTTKVDGRGSGMGLAMVYGIVSNHGGSITLESQKGKGTSFVIRLPSLPPRLVDQVEKQVHVPARGRGSILVVDDHDVARSATMAMLESLGYDVIGVKDGREAVRHVAEQGNRVDLVVLDFIMPGMSAAECLDGLRRLRPELRVVLSTGFANSQSVQKLLEAEGVRGMVQKPFQLYHLSQVVSDALAFQGH